MLHKMRLNPGPFERIKAGKQKIETRLNDEKRQKVRVGDEIEFSKRPDLKDKFSVRVLGLERFESFEDLLKSCDPVSLGFERTWVENLDGAARCYLKYYPKDEEEKYGVLAIRLRLKNE